MVDQHSFRERRKLSQLPLLERAFELARSGKVGTVDELVRRLKREGFLLVDAHIAGSSRLRRELSELCRASWVAAGNEPIKSRR